MPPKDFKFPLSNNVFGTVYFRTEAGSILEFVVKLHYIKDSREYEIMRYDTAHGGVHRDVLLPDGSKFVVNPFHSFDNKVGLTFAIQDIQMNWELYIERFERWLRKEK